MTTRERVRRVAVIAAAAAATVAGIAATTAFRAGGFRVPAAFAAPDDGDVIAGSVFDEATKRPVASASVLLWRRPTPLFVPGEEAGPPGDELDWPAKPSRTATTDAQGRFTFPREASAPLRWLTIAAPGYATTVVDVTAPGAPRSVALAAVKLRRFQIVRFTGAAPTPVAGAEVLLFPKGTRGPLAARFTTGADGRVAVPQGPEAALVVRGPGVATARLRGDSRDEGVELVGSGGPVAGVVTNASGAPVAGARISVRARGPSLVAVTDAAGKFRIEGVDCLEEPSEMTVEAPGCQEMRIPVYGGDTSVAIVAAPGVTVRGRVLDPSGKPAAGVGVIDLAAGTAEHLAERDEVLRATRTGADGTFAIEGVPAGVRTFAASGTAQRTEVLVPGATPTEVVLRQRASTVPVTVRVLDEARLGPVRNVRVSLPRTNTEARTGDDGTVRIDVFPSADGPTEIQFNGGPLGASKLVARVSRAAFLRGRLDVALATEWGLRLRFVEPGGMEIPREQFMVLVVLDADDVEVAVSPDRDTMWKEADVVVPGVQRFRIVAGSLSRNDLALYDAVHRRADAVEGVLEIKLRRAPTAHGRIAPVKSDAATQTIVMGVPVGGFDLAHGRNGVMGELVGGVARVAFPVPGRWAFRVEQGGDFASRTIALRTIELRADEDLDLGALDAPGVTLRGVVRCAGRPVGGARVAVEIDPAISINRPAAPDGSYLLPLPAGVEGKLIVSRDGFGSVGRPFRAVADATLDLELAPEATLLVRNARDALGLPLRLTVRAAGVERIVVATPVGCEAVIGRLAPGPVEILFTDAAGPKTARATATAGRVVEVDLASK